MVGEERGVKVHIGYLERRDTFSIPVHIRNSDRRLFIEISREEKRIISHSGTSITKLMWALVNIQAMHVHAIIRKGEEENKVTNKQNRKTTVERLQGAGGE